MHERIIQLYEDNAAEWDRDRGSQLIEGAWLDRFAALLRPGARLLDLGCGSGWPIAAYLIDLGLDVTGIDSSPSLIALARERFPGQQWLVGDIRHLSLGRTFDGLLAWHSSFHLTQGDQRALFPRLAAHAEPGAPLMFTSGPKAGVSMGEWQGEPLYHASLDPDEYERLLDENGFVVVERVFDDPECGGASVWLAQMSPASGLDGSA